MAIMAGAMAIQDLQDAVKLLTRNLQDETEARKDLEKRCRCRGTTARAGTGAPGSVATGVRSAWHSPGCGRIRADVYTHLWRLGPVRHRHHSTNATSDAYKRAPTGLTQPRSFQVDGA